MVVILVWLSFPVRVSVSFEARDDVCVEVEDLLSGCGFAVHEDVESGGFGGFEYAVCDSLGECHEWSEDVFG